MPSEATGRKQLARAQNPISTYATQKVAESLPCPRCDSTNTKFCYYNNYNLSQPRHFCKSCRRYWTQGGTLRSIPVGGGTRKNYKRTRNGSTSSSTTTITTSSSDPVLAASTAVATISLSSTCSSTVNHEQRVAHIPDQVTFFPYGNPESGLVMTTSDANLNESSANIPVTAAASFTTTLNMQSEGQNFLEHGGGIHGFEIGSGLDDLGLGFGAVRSWENPSGYAGGSSGCNTWQAMNGGDAHQGGNAGVGEDCFGWPGVTIFTPGVKGFK